MVTFYWNEEQNYKIIEMLKCKKKIQMTMTPGIKQY